jgi:group I intron endonuclease
MSSSSIYTGIYLITSPSGKYYVGQSVDIDKRYKQYKNLHCKSQPKLYNSIKKHGQENHIFEILHHCIEEELNLWERYYQEEYDVIGTKGLNCCLTGTDDKRGILSDETRKKMSDAAKNKPPFTEEHKKKIGDANSGEKNYVYGKTRTEEFKLKVSITNSGENNPSYKGKINQYNKITREFIKSSFSWELIEEGFNIHHITDCINHPDKHKSHRGFIWKRD